MTRTSEIIDLLAALVRAESVNPPGSELSVATILSDWLRARGVMVDVHQLSNTRANLLARVPGHSHKPALAFCGHMDTVPVGSAAWTHPPFGAEIVDRYLYGRGASDMKGGLAAMAAALVALARRATPIACDVLFFATAGEEVDNCGASEFAEKGLFDQVGGLVVGEPTSMEIAVAHKGALWVRASIPGHSAHGSMPQLGSNAILHAYDFLHSLLAYRFNVQAHPLLGLPTVSPNIIQGGSGANLVPDQCQVTLDIRSVPGLPHQSILRDLQTILDDKLPQEIAKGSRIEVLLDRAPVGTEFDAAIVQTAIEVRRNLCMEEATVRGMSYYTDASIIAPSIKLPTIIWGPGNTDQAHKTDEYVDIQQVLLASQLYEQLAVHYSSRAL
jgi:succinyl-diaminopimelate desuccinylase